MNNDQASPETQNTTTGTEKSIKLWSERTNKWRYVPKDPTYFKTKYYEYTHAKPCPINGAIIHTQMIRHKQSKKCQLVKAGLLNEVEQIECVILEVKQEILND